MNNKTIILIGIIVILLAVVIGGGIGLINNAESPLQGIITTESTVDISIYPYGSSSYNFHTQTINSMINSMENYNNQTNETKNSDIINWLKTFDDTKYILIDDGGGEYYILERTEFNSLQNNLSTKKLTPIKSYRATIKTNIIETKITESSLRDFYYIKNPELIKTTQIS